MRGIVRVCRLALPLLFIRCAGNADAPTAPQPAPGTEATQVEPLRDAAAATGRLVGAAVKASLLRSDATYAAAFARHFGYVTAEFEMKWGQIERQRGQRYYQLGDEIVAFAQGRGISIKGHALVWHGDSPAWLEGLSADEVRAALQDHIRTTVGRYRGRIMAWDVVNEAIADGNGGLRETVYLRKLGPGTSPKRFDRRAKRNPRRCSSTTTTAARA